MGRSAWATTYDRTYLWARQLPVWRLRRTWKRIRHRKVDPEYRQAIDDALDHAVQERGPSKWDPVWGFLGATVMAIVVGGWFMIALYGMNK